MICRGFDTIHRIEIIRVGKDWMKFLKRVLNIHMWHFEVSLFEMTEIPGKYFDQTFYRKKIGLNLFFAIFCRKLQEKMYTLEF